MTVQANSALLPGNEPGIEEMDEKSKPVKLAIEFDPANGAHMWFWIFVLRVLRFIMLFVMYAWIVVQICYRYRDGKWYLNPIGGQEITASTTREIDMHIAYGSIFLLAIATHITYLIQTIQRGRGKADVIPTYLTKTIVPLMYAGMIFSGGAVSWQRWRHSRADIYFLTNFLFGVSMTWSMLGHWWLGISHECAGVASLCLSNIKGPLVRYNQAVHQMVLGCQVYANENVVMIPNFLQVFTCAFLLWLARKDKASIRLLLTVFLANYGFTVPLAIYKVFLFGVLPCDKATRPVDLLSHEFVVNRLSSWTTQDFSHVVVGLCIAYVIYRAIFDLLRDNLDRFPEQKSHYENVKCKLPTNFRECTELYADEYEPFWQKLENEYKSFSWTSYAWWYIKWILTSWRFYKVTPSNRLGKPLHLFAIPWALFFCVVKTFMLVVVMAKTDPIFCMLEVVALPILISLGFYPYIVLALTIVFARWEVMHKKLPMYRSAFSFPYACKDIADIHKLYAFPKWNVYDNIRSRFLVHEGMFYDHVGALPAMGSSGRWVETWGRPCILTQCGLLHPVHSTGSLMSFFHPTTNQMTFAKVSYGMIVTDNWLVNRFEDYFNYVVGVVPIQEYD